MAWSRRGLGLRGRLRSVQGSQRRRWHRDRARYARRAGHGRYPLLRREHLLHSLFRGSGRRAAVHIGGLRRRWRRCGGLQRPHRRRTAEFAGQSPTSAAGSTTRSGATSAATAASPTTASSGASTIPHGVLVEVRGVDDFTNDSSVGLTVYSGALPAHCRATLGFDGHLAAGQTFGILAPSSWTLPRASSAVVSGPVVQTSSFRSAWPRHLWRSPSTHSCASTSRGPVSRLA